MEKVVKVLRKGYPVFVVTKKVSELDNSKCSPKFLELGLPDDYEVHVKCFENGTIDLRGKKQEYRIIPKTAVIA